MAILHMRIACCITKATHTPSEYVIHIVFHGNNGYAKGPQCCVYTYTARLFSSLKHPHAANFLQRVKRALFPGVEQLGCDADSSPPSSDQANYTWNFTATLPLDFMTFRLVTVFYDSVSQPPGRGPVPGPGINYTGPREVLLEFVILVF